MVAAAEPQWDSEDILALFPDERRPPVVPSFPDVGRLSALYSPLYRTMIGAVASLTAARFDLPEGPLSLPAREALVPLVHAYLDRVLRMDRVLRGLSPRDCRVPRCAAAPRPGDILEFSILCSSSFEFNQELVRRLAGLWGVAEDGEVSSIAVPAPQSYTNRNFQRVGLATKVRRRTLQALGDAFLAAGWIRPCPALSMAYHTDALKNNGFYFRHLHSVERTLKIRRPPADPRLRREIVLEAVLERGGEVRNFLAAAGLSAAAPAEALVSDLAAFAAELYPAAYLEGLGENLREARAVLRPFVPRPLFCAEGNNEEATLLMAGAKLNGQEVIGIQHGGYSGYIDDHAGAVEYEYPHLDRFLSWGWSEMPDHEACRAVRVTPLPSPWLSDRAAWWARVLPESRRDPRGKPHDFLFMSSRIYRFDPAPSGQVVFRADSIGEYARLLGELVQTCQERGANLIHKNFNERSRWSLSRSLERLAREFPSAYRPLETSDKGMAPEILDSCAVVLWDQPGTGFLECLAAGIPTMVLWPRLYSREEPRRRPLFEALEAVGLVHTGARGLLDELGRFKEDHRAWGEDLKRREAVERFTRELGWSSPDWPGHWRRFLEKEVS